MIRTRSLIVAVILLASAAHASAQDQPWDREAAAKELNGMRNYAWVFSDAIAKAMASSSAEDYPAIHAYLRDFRKARKEVDREKKGEQRAAIDTEQLMIRNPRYWAAYYEVAPGDPLLFWLHACMYAANGHVHRTFYHQQFALKSPIDSKWEVELPRLLVSSSRVIQLAERGIRQGVAAHDKKDYEAAEAAYRDVLQVAPSHARAIYELAYTLRTSKQKDERAVQAMLEEARYFDPFLLAAYQGSFNVKEFKRVQVLRSKAGPAWRKLLQSSAKQLKATQLEELSAHLQAAGLHEFALPTRQLLVAMRGESYRDDDRKYIELSLKALLPKADVSGVIERLTSDVEPLRIKDLSLGRR